MENNSGIDEENTADQKNSNRSILGQLRVSQSKELLLVHKTSIEEEEKIHFMLMKIYLLRPVRRQNEQFGHVLFRLHI